MATFYHPGLPEHTTISRVSKKAPCLLVTKSSPPSGGGSEKFCAATVVTSLYRSLLLMYIGGVEVKRADPFRTISRVGPSERDFASQSEIIVW